MNWTGGQLQRHSRNAVRGTHQKQRQHFAKVRTQLQNGTNSAGARFCPSFFYSIDTQSGDHHPFFSDDGALRPASQEVGHQASPPQEQEKRNRTRRAHRRSRAIASQKDSPSISHHPIPMGAAVSATSHGHGKQYHEL